MTLFRRIRVVHTKSLGEEEEETIEALKAKLAEAEERANAAEEVLAQFRETNVDEVTNVIVSKILSALRSNRTIEAMSALRYELDYQDDIPPGKWETLEEGFKEREMDCMLAAIEHGLEVMDVDEEFEEDENETESGQDEGEDSDS